jgi:hypothetical protein
MTTGRSARWHCRSGARTNQGDGENDSSENDHTAFWLTNVADGSSGIATIHDDDRPSRRPFWRHHANAA